MSLLEAFEKLLASLIILAILVLIMFLAFDNDRVVSTPGSERFDTRYEEPPAAPPAPRQQVTQQEAAPPAAPAPAPAPQARNGQQPPAPGNGKVPVPDPGAPPVSPAPVTPPRQDMAKAPEPEAPKQPPADVPVAKEPGKKFYAALRKEKEPAQQSVAETKSARHEPHLKRTSAERTLPPATKRARGDEGTVHRTEYKTHARTEYRDRWDRNHYYECTGGECSCDCNRPYWSQSDVCADY